MLEALPGDEQVVRIEINAGDDSIRSCHDVVGQEPDPAAEIEDPLACSYAFDEEVVIAGQPVLDVDTAIVADGHVVNLPRDVIAQLEQVV